MSDVKPIGEFVSKILSPEKRAEIERHRARLASDAGYARACEDEHQEIAGSWQASEDAARRLSAESLRRERMARSRIPDRVRRVLKDQTETKPLLRAKTFCEQPETILVLAGGTGAGKTVAACAALAGYEAQGLFVSAVDLVRAGLYSQEFWESLKVPGILVIDDLGREPLDEKGWGISNLHATLNDRYDNLRKTIITTNLSQPAFLARYDRDGGRLRDRLKSGGVYFEFAGTSLRLV
jgi:DNA replication protein DnaC